MDAKRESTCGGIAWSRVQSGRRSPGRGAGAHGDLRL